MMKNAKYYLFKEVFCYCECDNVYTEEMVNTKEEHKKKIKKNQPKIPFPSFRVPLTVICHLFGDFIFHSFFFFFKIILWFPLNKERAMP